jgi:hypothetical protein
MVPPDWSHFHIAFIDATSKRGGPPTVYNYAIGTASNQVYYDANVPHSDGLYDTDTIIFQKSSYCAHLIKFIHVCPHHKEPKLETSISYFALRAASSQTTLKLWAVLARL